MGADLSETEDHRPNVGELLLQIICFSHGVDALDEPFLDDLVDLPFNFVKLEPEGVLTRCGQVKKTCIEKRVEMGAPDHELSQEDVEFLFPVRIIRRTEILFEDLVCACIGFAQKFEIWIELFDGVQDRCSSNGP